MKFDFFIAESNQALTQEAREFFIENGFVVAKQIFSKEKLNDTKPYIDRLISTQSESDAKDHLSLGSLLRLWQEPYFSSLIASAEINNALKQLGSNDLKFSNGFLFSKPPACPPTFWHQDWWLWNEDCSFTKEASQIGALIYLEDTCQQNGCLRVIPKSHIKRHKFHDLQQEYETKKLRKYEDPNAKAFSNFSDEIDVSVKVGDVIFFDARLLHAAHSNNSSNRRNALTFWYFPNYNLLSNEIKSSIGNPQIPEDWPKSYSNILSPLLPRYYGTTKPANIFCEGSPRD